MKIEQIEPELAQKLDLPLKNALQDLGYSVFPHDQLHVSFRRSDRRKEHRDADASNWSPQSGRIEIWYEPVTQELRQAAPESAPNRPGPEPEGPRSPNNSLNPAEVDLLKALDRAESTPGWRFVSLKKFRDEILPSDHEASKYTDVVRQNVLRLVIEKRFVLTGQVHNPKAPQFPVTTIRLNRLMPEVQRVLGQTESQELDFHPIEIRGEPLSATILRERR